MHGEIVKHVTRCWRKCGPFRLFDNMFHFSNLKETKMIEGETDEVIEALVISFLTIESLIKSTVVIGDLTSIITLDKVTVETV